MLDTISSNTLFHFTPKFDYLKNILTEGFRPRYCVENIDYFRHIFRQESLEMAIPMVSFCDIPLSKVRSHMDFYGNYGIGLSKEWAIRLGICPLIYLSDESETTKLISVALERLKNNPLLKNDREELLQQHFDRILRLIRFTKPYSGRSLRNGNYEKEARIFYNEREWRYVPDISLDINQKKFDLAEAWITKEYFDILNQFRKNKELGKSLKTVDIESLNNEMFQILPLNISIKDVKYIIVEDEFQKIEILDIIRSRYIENIAPTVLTRKQVNEDI